MPARFIVAGVGLSRDAASFEMKVDPKMKARPRGDNEKWTSEGPKITDAANLEAFRKVIEDDGPVLVTHWFYCGARGPRRLVFDELDELLQYLNDVAYAGDIIDVWSFVAVCTYDNQLGSGMCPDDDGQVPVNGAY